MKRVIVTGATGFLGHWVCKELKNRNYEVYETNSSFDLTEEGLDHSMIKALDKSLDVPYIVHLAALCGGIGANRKSPATFLESNIKMGINVFESAHHYSCPKLVCLGSVCSYPKHTPVPFKEENLWNGYPEETNAAYGIAKRVLLEQMKAYRAQYGLNGIFLIPVNLYGPQDHFDLENSHVIPALIRKFYEAKLNNESVELWGTGSASREFLYVKDCAKGIVDALEKYNGEEPVNLGTGREITIKNLAELIAKKVDYNGKIEWNIKMPDGQPRRCLDVSKAKEYFGFEAQTPFEQGLDETIEWYINNRINILLGEK